MSRPWRQRRRARSNGLIQAREVEKCIKGESDQGESLLEIAGLTWWNQSGLVTFLYISRQLAKRRRGRGICTILSHVADVFVSPIHKHIRLTQSDNTLGCSHDLDSYVDCKDWETGHGRRGLVYCGYTDPETSKPSVSSARVSSRWGRANDRPRSDGQLAVTFLMFTTNHVTVRSRNKPKSVSSGSQSSLSNFATETSSKSHQRCHQPTAPSNPAPVKSDKPLLVY